MLHDYEIEIKLKNDSLCTVRGIASRDAEEYMKCMIQIMDETEYDTYYPDELTTNVKQYEDFLSAKENNPYSIQLGAFFGDKLLGMISIEPYGYCSKLKHRATLSLMVKSEYSNLGIGYSLSIEAIELAKEVGYEVIMLDVVKDNLVAVHLYEKLGFIPYGVFEKYFKKRTGEYQDNILMRLDLKK